ncbi:MAG: REP-associated tyrosine transposase [Acidobacteriaceae bacterium]
MRLRPQTYAITAVTHDRLRVFQRTSHAERMVSLLFRYRDQDRYAMHGFVVMPDHIHVLFTPVNNQTVERCVQCIKGGFSFAVRESYRGEIWQRSFHEHRIRDVEDFQNQAMYIAMNPERRRWVDYPFVHLRYMERLDPMPEYLRG